MKNLILITNFFPFGKGEPYLETEVRFYEKYFDNIIVVSLQLQENMVKERNLPSTKFKVIPIKKERGYKYILESFKSLIDINFYRELKYLFCNKKFNIKRLISLMFYLTRSHHDKKQILKWMSKNKIELNSSEGIIYSYRFDYQPYLGLLLKKNFPLFKCISRGHRHDLYEEKRINNYIPLREILLNKLNKIYMISQDGVNYLNSKHLGFEDKIFLSRLGTFDYGLGPEPKRDVVRLVSCSTITPVKRLHLIINALSTIDNMNIEWHHFGTGVLDNEIKKLSEIKLGPNVKSIFHGHIDNLKMMEIYQNNPFDIFVNVSSSEGVPVSIMEAMSFGIPILATNVGGTSEIVTDGYSGLLLDEDFESFQFKDKLNRILGNKDMRSNARKEWEDKSDANKLYPRFLQNILLS